MLAVLILQTVLQLQTDYKETGLLTFDFQSTVAGRIFLHDCTGEIIQAAVVYPTNVTASHFVHVEWQLPKYCQTWTLAIDPPSALQANLQVKNGWFYQSETILQEGPSYFLEFLNGQWSATNQSNIGCIYYQDPARLQLHFSTIRGWINDPNGLVYHNGWYHLYYQYNPYQTHWNNMHWGHAVSKDLMSWQHLPIAIYPSTQLSQRYVGGIFTGSAMYYNNEFLAVYTDHFQDQKNVSATQIEQQIIVTSADSLTYGNKATAVYRHPFNSTKDFRDPKIWYDSQRKTLYMVLGTFMNGQPSVLLYKSSDSKTWAYANILYQDTSIPALTIECPDFFPLGDAKDQYVLIFDTFQSTPTKMHRMFGIVGTFDGQTFNTSTNIPHELDFGQYFYAMQTYNNAPNNTRIGIGWMNNWDNLQGYADANHSFAGAMGIPRKIILINGQTAIGMTPIPAYTNYRKTTKPFFSGNINNFTSSPSMISQGMPLLEVHVTSINTSGAWELLFHANSINYTTNPMEAVHLIWNATTNVVTIVNDFNQGEIRSSPVINAASLNITVILDKTSIEVFINHGLATGSMRFIPSALSNAKVFFKGSANAAVNIDAWQLNSVWINDHCPVPTPSSTASTDSSTASNSGALIQTLHTAIYTLITVICFMKQL